MAVYNKESLKAEEFINHGEILETLRYADEHKNDRDLLELDESVFDNVSAAYLAIQDQLEGELEG